MPDQPTPQPADPEPTDPDPVDTEAATIDARSPDAPEQIEELIDESLEEAAVDAGGRRVGTDDVEGPNPA